LISGGAQTGPSVSFDAAFTTQKMILEELLNRKVLDKLQETAKKEDKDIAREA